MAGYAKYGSIEKKCDWQEMQMGKLGTIGKHMIGLYRFRSSSEG